MVANDKVVREGYKLSEVGQIPLNWDLKTVGDLYKFEGGQQPPRKYFSSIEQEGYIRLIQIRDYKTDKYKTYIPKELAKRFCNADDIMIGRYGPPIFQILRGLEGSYNVALIKAIPNELLDKEYAYYFLCDEKLFYLIDRLSQRTSGQTGVDMEALKSYFFPLPPLKEQQKIAEILSTVDKQIENTEQLIEKTKELKKGLMQQLLTKGIGHTEFKQTELGEIPVEWEVEEGFITIKSGFGFKLKEYSDEGLPLIRINNISHGKMKLDDLCFLPNSFEEEYSDFILNKGDILLALNRPITHNKLKIAKFTEEQGMLYQRVGKLCMDNEKYYSEFYFQYLQSSGFIKRLESTFVGSDQPFIKVTEFYKMLLPVPSIEEQIKIVKILTSIDEQIESYEQEKEKYLELKKGLMQQLLTGKIRVTV